MRAVISFLLQSRKFWWYLLLFGAASRRHNTNVIQYLPVHSACHFVNVKLWGVVTKIRFWSKTCMIQKGTAPKS